MVNKTASLLGHRGDELVLRVCGPERDDRVFRLAGSKCTIGGDPRCTLALPAGGDSPLHCLILRGPSTTVVRRWSRETRLNGQAFHSAPLAAGDRLSIGPVELEVLGTEAAEPCRAERAALAAREAELAGEAERLRSDRHCLAEERQGLDRQRAAWRQERKADEEAVAQERADVAQARAEAEQAGREAEAAAEARRAEQDALAAREAELAGETDRLRSANASLEARSRELDARQQQIEAREDQLELYRARLEERAAALSRRNAAAASQPEADLKEHRTVGQSASLPAREAPLTSGEVFTRMGIELDLHDDEPAEAAAGSVPADGNERLGPARPRTEATTSEAGERPGDEEDEETVEAYMSRLLERVTEGTGKRSPSAPATARHRARDADREDALPAEPPRGVDRQGGGTPADTLSEDRGEGSRQPAPASLAPRTSAPERSVNFSAMRELANLSADAAISTHARRTLRGTFRSKIAVIVVSSSTAMALLWLGWQGAGRFAFLAAGAGLTVAVQWTLQFLVLTGHLSVGHTGRLHPGQATAPDQDNDATASEDRPAEAAG